MKAICIGGPLSGREIPDQQTQYPLARVTFDSSYPGHTARNGEYRRVLSGWDEIGRGFVRATQVFAVWFPA